MQQTRDSGADGRQKDLPLILRLHRLFPGGMRARHAPRRAWYSCIWLGTTVTRVGSLALKWRIRDLEFDESAKLGISATILTWSAYYVNRPHAWNLWTFQFLYLFLVADIVEPGLFRRLRRHGMARAIFDFRLASLTFLLVPMLLREPVHFPRDTVTRGETRDNLSPRFQAF
jgi:hypothetical protein